MFNHSVVRISIILLYFITCTACGSPKDIPAKETAQEEGTSIAGDVNMLGGGTNAPDRSPSDEPYDSPNLSAAPPPSTVTWMSSIEQALKVAERDKHMKIMLWFTSAECVDCSKMESELFTDPEVIAESDKWLFVKVDCDLNKERADYYMGGGSPPAIMAMDNMGTVYRKTFDTVNKAEFINMLTIWR